MDELEQRLRSALTEMAGEVPPSHRAWDEQQRRLALKSRRDRLRPALVAAVAAAVVALIAVPVVILNLRTPPVDVGAVPLVTNPPETSSAVPRTKDRQVGYRSLGGEKLASEPMIVGGRSGFSSPQPPYIYRYAYTIRTATGSHQLCFAEAAEGAEINGPDQSKLGQPLCSPLVRPRDGQYYWGNRQAPGDSGTGSVYVYVMSQPADNLMLREVNDKLVLAQSRSTGDELVVFAAYLQTKQQPKAFTVRDVHNAVLQNGP